MRKIWFWPLAAAVLGLLGGVLRAFEKQYTIEEKTGLLIAGQPLTYLTILFCIICAAALILPFLRYKTAMDGAAAFSGNSGLKICAGISAVVLCACSFFGLYRYADTGRLSLLIFACLTIFSAVSIVLVTSALKGESFKGGSVSAVVPVFWACFWLILSYGEHAADPVIVDYLYLLIGESAVIIALYLFAQLMFDDKRLRGLAVFALLSVFFSALNLIEPIACLIFFNNDSLIENLLTLRLYFVFPLVFMPVVSVLLIEKLKLNIKRPE